MSEWIEPGLINDVRAHLLENPGPITASAVATAVQRTGRVIGSAALLELVSRISAQLAGAGPLQPLLDEPGVTDVFVNGPRDIWVDRGTGLVPVRLSLGGEPDVRTLAVRLAALGGRRLDDSTPLVDVQLPDGVRLNAVIPPLSGEHTVMSFRIPRPRGFTLGELIDSGAVPAAIAELLQQVLNRRANFLISGGTGSGKTALLGALLAESAADQRLVIVEDSRELTLDHPHVVQLSSRQANVEGAGAVTLTDLVRNALRMRPDRLVVGECRGAEVRDMLTALNTGHEGGCATIHANTAEAVPARLEALGALAGMAPAAVRSQVASAIDVIIHIRRLRPGDPAATGSLRQVSELSVPRADPTNGRITMHPVWHAATGFDAAGLEKLTTLLAERGSTGGSTSSTPGTGSTTGTGT